MNNISGKKKANSVCLAQRRFAAERGSLPRILAWLQQQSERLLLPEKKEHQENKMQAMRLQLAAEEAVTNVVDYAYAVNAGASDKYLEAAFWQEDGFLTLVLEDGGIAFDPLAGEIADSDLPLAERSPGGWGTAMLRRFTDAAFYARQDGKNILRLSVRLKDGAPL